jgi:hypothetical protein
MSCNAEPWCVTLIDTGDTTLTGDRLRYHADDRAPYAPHSSAGWPACAEADVDEMAVIAKWDRVFVSMGFDFTRPAEKLP